MIPASHIKKTIDFNTRFRNLLEVLKLVAVQQYYALEAHLKTFGRLEEVLEQFFDSIDVSGVNHPFLQASGKPAGVIAVTSDAGLLGGMNLQVMSKALELVAEENGRLVIVGEKGQGYAKDFGVPFTSYPGVSDANRYRQAMEIRDEMIRDVVQGRLGAVKVVYSRALSFVIHRVEAETLIPFTGPAVEKKTGASAYSKDVILESSPAEVLEYLVYLTTGKRIYEIFGMSRLAEQAARFTHLEESCQKILDMNKKLTLQYFRRRHEMIDQNMRELFASRSVYAK